MRIIISRRTPPQMSMFESYGSYAGGKMSTASSSAHESSVYVPKIDPEPSLIPETTPTEHNIPSADAEGGDVEDQNAQK